LHSKTKLSYLRIFGLSKATRVRNTPKYPLSRLQKLGIGLYAKPYSKDSIISKSI